MKKLTAIGFVIASLASALVACGNVETGTAADNGTADSGTTDTGNTDTGTTTDSGTTTDADSGNACQLGNACTPDGVCATDANVVCKCGSWMTVAQANGISCTTDSGTTDTGNTDTGTTTDTGADTSPPSGVNVAHFVANSATTGAYCRMVLTDPLSDANAYYSCADDGCLFGWMAGGFIPPVAGQNGILTVSGSCSNADGGSLDCTVTYPQGKLLYWSCEFDVQSPTTGAVTAVYPCSKNAAWPTATGDSLTVSVNGVVVNPIHLKTGGSSKAWPDSYGCVGTSVPTGKGTYAPY